MIRILCIGKMKDKALHLLEEEYTKRLRAFTKIQILEVRDEPNERIEREKEAALAKEKEGERALASVREEAGRMDFLRLRPYICHRRLTGTFPGPSRKSGCPLEALRPHFHASHDARSRARADLQGLYDPERKKISQVTRSRSPAAYLGDRIRERSAAGGRRRADSLKYTCAVSYLTSSRSQVFDPYSLIH